MDQQTDFGVIGLGVMGASLALNVADKGFTVSAYNRSRDKTDEMIAGYSDKSRVRAAYELKDLVAQLSRPRRILLMLKAGTPVDDTIRTLAPMLQPGDVLIDGGNELFTNTQRRAAELEAKGLRYVGMGVSGGQEGARHGPSMMPGGTLEGYAAIEPIVKKIAAQVSDGPCVTYIGPGGSGHYVKMVHNGIEYGDMQLIAEIYDVLKHLAGLDNSALGDTFDEWNKTELESFLIEITARVFRQKDPLGSGDLLDAILDTASMKGTGGWTVQQGAELGSPIPTIASAVDARILSAAREVRLEGARRLRGPTPEAVPAAERKAVVADARAALYAAKAVSYAQGLALLASAARTYGWTEGQNGARFVDLRELARIWKGGCIIRARLLGDIQEALSDERARDGNLLFARSFAEALAARQDGWRRIVGRAVSAGIAVPALSASLAYYDTLRRARTPANLVQAQRDLFGAHTYQRTDRDGTFHTEWV